VDPLNPPPPTFNSYPEDVIEVEDTVEPEDETVPASVHEIEPEDMTEAENLIEHEDETVPASVHEVGESSTAPFLREDIDGLLPGFMRRDINSLLVGLLLFQDDCVVAKRRMHWSRRKEKKTTSIM
nr:hypothetical protein [Tanacetum cinerariifolium]